MHNKIELNLSNTFFILFVLSLIIFSIILLIGPKPLMAFIIVLAIPILIFLAYRPQYGFYIIVFLIPFVCWRALFKTYQFLTISKLIGIWIVIILIIKLAIKKEIDSFLKSNIWYLLFGFFLVSVISTLYSKYPLISINNLRKLATAYIFLALTIIFVKEYQFKKTIPLLLISSLSISALIAIIGALFHIPSLTMNVKSQIIQQRAIGIANDPNFFAAMVLLSLPLIAHFFFVSQSLKFKLLLASLFLLNCYAIVITYSRAAVLVFVFIIILILLEYIKKLRIKYLGFVLLLTSILLFVGIKKIPTTNFWQRMKTLSIPQVDISLSRRVSYIYVSWEAFKKNPLLGSGPGTFPMIYRNSLYATAFGTEESGYARAAHNTYLEVLVGTGLLGLILFCSILGYAFRCLYIAQKRFKQAGRFIDAAYIRSISYSLFSFLTSILFLSNLYHKYIWFLLGLSIIALKLTEERTSE